MRRDQLEHAIRAACDVSGDTELLLERVAGLPVESDRRDSISRWVRATMTDVG